MDAINPPPLPGQAAPRGPAPPTASGSSAAAAAATEGAVVDAPPAAAALEKRKRLGQHVVPAPPAVVAPPAPAKRVKRPSSKVSAAAPAPKKAAPKKAAKKPPAARMASLTALTAALVTAPPEPADARNVVDESPAVDDALESHMENSASHNHVAAMAARLPPVRYYVPYEEEEEKPVQDPDSPQSPSQVSDLFPPLVILNRSHQLLDYDDKDNEPRPPAPEVPAPATRTRPWPEEDDDLYYVADEDDPESRRKGLDVQSKRYAVFAPRHYNADPSNIIKYELLEATHSNGIVLDSGHIIGHVTFTARATAGHDTAAPGQAHPRPFFAEVHEPDLVPRCMISMDDEEERGEDDDLCQFCGAGPPKHPKVHPELPTRQHTNIVD
ncbi:hypothetical protein ACQ4PT_014973 [Festuca glaucescens]